MYIGIKFCGGCNPRFNRNDTAESLIEELTNIHVIEIAFDKNVYDLIIVICGCMNCCDSYKNSSTNNRVIIINNLTKLEDIIQKLKSME